MHVYGHAASAAITGVAMDKFKVGEKVVVIAGVLKGTRGIVERISTSGQVDFVAVRGAVQTFRMPAQRLIKCVTR